mgnify:CR=1 FL=1
MSYQSEFEKYAVKHRGISSNTLDSYGKYSVTALTANVIEERPMNIAVMDVYSRLMMDRIIFLGYPINDEVANIVSQGTTRATVILKAGPQVDLRCQHLPDVGLVRLEGDRRRRRKRSRWPGRR